MAGFSNITGDESIMFADNASFDGTERTGKLTTNGQLWIGATSSPHVKKGSITSPLGTIVIGYSSPNITLDVVAGGFKWNDITTATQIIAVENGYVTDRSGGVTYTLPASANFGDEFIITGKLGLWTLAQNAGQQITFSSSSTTVGVAGSLAATNLGDSIWAVCTTAGGSTIWRVYNSIGNITVT